MQEDFQRLFRGEGGGGVEEKFRKLGDFDLNLIPSRLTVKPVGQKYKIGKICTKRIRKVKNVLPYKVIY